MSDLVIPIHLVEERLRADFKPFIRYAVSICPNALRKDFERKVMGWLTSLPAGAVAELKQTYFQGKPPQKATLPKGGKNPKHLTAVGVKIAQVMVNKFIDNAKEGEGWKAGQGSRSQSAVQLPT